MGSEWEKLKKQVANLQLYLNLFDVKLLDRDGFKEFADQLYTKVSGYSEICITGYFSETIRAQLDRITNYVRTRGSGRVRLISRELYPKQKKRDRKNLEALRKMADKGAAVRINDRIHARILVAYTRWEKSKLQGGLLVLGSFDFNTECIGKERYDAGIITKHPDLVDPASKLFDEVWEESTDLDKWVRQQKITR